MSTIKIIIQGSSLASRAKAAEFRKGLTIALSTSELVELDLTSIDSISHSYADELFGILALQYGLDTLGEKLRIMHASDDTMLVIAQCIHDRVNNPLRCASTI